MYRGEWRADPAGIRNGIDELGSCRRHRYLTVVDYDRRHILRAADNPDRASSHIQACRATPPPPSSRPQPLRRSTITGSFAPWRTYAA